MTMTEAEVQQVLRLLNFMQDNYSNKGLLSFFELRSCAICMWSTIVG
jgi:hypothetical protein